MRHLGGFVIRSVADALYPPGCMACSAPVADARMLCAPCWSDAHLIDGTPCDGCGTPMPLALARGDTIRCDACLAGPMSWDRGRAAALYAGSARSMVLALKHGDKPDIAHTLGRWMLRAAEDIIAESDVVVPIPLHWRRFLKRRYNQSAELSRIIARLSGKPHGPDLLRRIRPTDMQRSHSAKQRSDNVRGVFEVPSHMRPVVCGKKILLVDDVLTTGATLNAATGALREYGAAHVSIVVFARVEQSTNF